MAEKFEEKLIALAVAEINAKRSAFYCAGEAFILSAAKFHEQWARLLTTGDTHTNHKGQKKVYWNCRLHQTRNFKKADKKA